MGSRRSERIDRALRAITAERYAEAVQRLERLLNEHADSRLSVLLSVVRARQAIVADDLLRARRFYETALRFDPGNALAQRELVILDAMGG